MTQSPRFGVPYLQVAQVQKETTVNEGFALFDLAVSAAVDGVLVDTPPASPAPGDCYIVGSEPSGAWAGHALALAGYAAGGWRFVAPVDGLKALDTTSGETVVFRSGTWEQGHVRAAKLSVGGNQVVGAQGMSVDDPSGGTTIDAEARGAIAAILARLRQHGLIAS